MNKTIKRTLKKIIPPIILDLIKPIKRYGWFGNYENWEEVERLATGYDQDEIVETVRQSLLKVKNGDAVHERDSVLFEEIEYSWPLLCGLMFAAVNINGTLSVLDFGGSLGSTYYQNRNFLNNIEKVSWNIVEQEQFVAIGRMDFEDDKLHFYNTVEECFEKEVPNVLVLSSVLQYLKEPYQFLDKLLKNNFKYIIIDRTSFNLNPKENDKIKLQIVPPTIYKASYPCWFFNEKKILEKFKKFNYKIIEKFDAIDGTSNQYKFNGYILEKKVDE